MQERYCDRLLYNMEAKQTNNQPLFIYFVSLKIKTISLNILNKCFTTEPHVQPCDTPIATSFHPKGNGFPEMSPTASRDISPVTPLTSSAACHFRTVVHPQPEPTVLNICYNDAASFEEPSPNATASAPPPFL